jgi:hypothetical protein
MALAKAREAIVYRLWRMLAVGCLTVLHLVLSSCAALHPAPSHAYETVRPQTSPARTITGFSESLRCMDGLFTAYGLGVQGIGKVYVTSQGLLDKTGQISPDVDQREMLISTISKMTARSEAFVFVNYNPRDPEELYKHLSLIARDKSQDFVLPNYEIVAAITELNANVSSASFGLSVTATDAFNEGDLGFSKGQEVTVLAVDFNVNHALTRQVLGGVTATNMIALARRSLAGNANAQIKKVGVAFNVALDRNEGVGAALRTLTELSLIEVLGKLAKVPYWQCLSLDQTHPEILAMTSDWFASMSDTARVTFVQRSLVQQGYSQEIVSGTLTPATREAIARYQAAMGLIPSGQIDLALYRQLIGRDRQAQGTPMMETGAQLTPTSAPALAAPALRLTLTTPRGTAPIYQINEQLALSVQVSQDAYLYCYYQDGQQRISRVYPNRFQPHAYVRAQQGVTIPDGQHFALVLDTAHVTEAVLCVASVEDVEVWLPHPLRAELETLPFKNLEEVTATIRRHNPRNVAEARLSVQVQ